MKKIIELAEKICNLNWVIRNEFIEQMRNEFTERRQLEQTPITEEWLKGHGFVVSNELHSKRDKIYIKENIKVYLDVDCRNGIIGNADCIEINGDSNSFHKDTYDNKSRITLADLYDILELCNIQID